MILIKLTIDFIFNPTLQVLIIVSTDRSPLLVYTFYSNLDLKFVSSLKGRIPSHTTPSSFLQLLQFAGQTAEVLTFVS